MLKNIRFSHKILMATSLVVTAAFILFTVYNYQHQKNSLQTNLESSLEDMGDVTARSIQGWLSGRIGMIESVAESLASNPQQSMIDDLLRQKVLNSTFTFTFLGTQEGRFSVSPPSAMPEGYDPRSRSWYQSAQAAGTTTLTEPYTDAATKKLIITIATPVPSVGVVGGSLSFETLVRIINTLDFGGIGYAFLVSADGKILIHPNKDIIGKHLKELYPPDTGGISRKIREVDTAKGKEFLTFTSVEGLPSVKWYIGLAVSKDKAYAPLIEFRDSAVIVTLIALASVILALSLLTRVLMRPLQAMGSAMQNIAQGEGDLTMRLAIHARDEFGELADAFNRFVERIHGSIREVSSTTKQLNEVARLVVDASISSMSNSDVQASRTNSVATAINELGAAAEEIARSAADASQQASSARSQAEDGRRVVETTINAINELSTKIRVSCGNIEALNSKTVNIGQILEVIKGISEQTNLLALNAAIEAARAGEAGRGFAVVADEVRSLAHRTQQSAQEIHHMIEELQVGAREAVTTMTESQRYSEQSVAIANQAGERLGSVTQRIGEIDSMNQSVATATEEQTAVVECLNMDITEINTLNQEGVENLQATLRACADLDHQAARLQQLVGNFRI
ncbi:methyl-accepting chemotaxis protein [Pseudomonas putida]|nr:methyl-accepting chemotaxis protein [Pseudomonas putida]